MITPRLILITDPAYDDAKIGATVEAVARALPRGALLVQLRAKTRPKASLLSFATELVLLTRRLGATLAINGDAEVARDSGARGVHLGEGAVSISDVRRAFGAAVCWLSLAAHTDDDVRQAVRARADAVLVSPIFRVPGKNKPRGLPALTSARAIAGRKVAVYALGGIDAARAASVAEAGAHGVAVIRALFDAADPAREARAIYDALEGAPPA